MTENSSSVLPSAPMSMLGSGLVSSLIFPAVKEPVPPVRRCVVLVAADAAMFDDSDSLMASLSMR